MAEPFNNVDNVRKTYFINEGERNVGDPSEDAGKVVQLEEDGRLNEFFLRNMDVVEVLAQRPFSLVNGLKAVTLHTEGVISETEADSSFDGFAIEPFVNADWLPEHNLVTGSGTSNSYTVPAGTNRLLLVATQNDFSAAAPTLNYNGNGFTVINQANNASNVSIQYQLLGTGSAITSSLTKSRNDSHWILTIENVDQTTPVGSSINFTSGGSQSISQTHPASRFFGHQRGRTWTASNIQVISGQFIRAERTQKKSYTFTSTVGANPCGVLVEVRPAAASAKFVRVLPKGILRDLTGLTPGANYYLVGSNGENVGTLATSGSVLVAKALNSGTLTIQ